MIVAVQGVGSFAGTGQSKRDAKEMAAMKALQSLGHAANSLASRTIDAHGRSRTRSRSSGSTSRHSARSRSSISAHSQGSHSSRLSLKGSRGPRRSFLQHAPTDSSGVPRHPEEPDSTAIPEMETLQSAASLPNLTVVSSEVPFLVADGVLQDSADNIVTVKQLLIVSWFA